MYRQNQLEKVLEKSLWSMRFLTLVPVFFGFISVIALYWLGTLEIIEGLGKYRLLEGEERPKYFSEIVGSIIGGIDLYLIGVVLMLVSFGLYELFISKIDIGRTNHELNILEVTSLDQLKEKVLKVIVMVLVVGFFKRVTQMSITGSLDLLYLAISILLIAASSYLLHISHGHPEQSHSHTGKS